MTSTLPICRRPSPESLRIHPEASRRGPHRGGAALRSSVATVLLNDRAQLSPGRRLARAAVAGFTILNDVVLKPGAGIVGTDGQTQRVIDDVQKDGTCWCAEPVSRPDRHADQRLRLGTTDETWSGAWQRLCASRQRAVRPVSVGHGALPQPGPAKRGEKSTVLSSMFEVAIRPQKPVRPLEFQGYVQIAEPRSASPSNLASSFSAIRRSSRHRSG